jgi:hypothetical protein
MGIFIKQAFYHDYNFYFVCRHPEFMFEKFNCKMFSLSFTDRRRLDKYYRQWDIENPPDESK